MATIPRRLGTILSLIFITFFFSTAFAIVDMRNANYSESWVDLQVKSSAYDLRVQRTYNSRTLFSGMFGFGWCAEFETTLAITATNTLRITECGAGIEIEYAPESYSPKKLDAVVKQIMAEVRQRNKNQTEAFFKKLEQDLRVDGVLRDEFTNQLNIKRAAIAGTNYYANGRNSDYISFNGTEYTRYLPNSTLQKFNQAGHLIQVFDKNSNSIKIVRKDDRIVSLQDASGSTLQFKYEKNSNRVATVSGPGGLSASYSYTAENLVAVSNAWKNTFKYNYDDLHNLTSISYPDKSTIEVTYNKDKDWVTGFKDRSGCTEAYKYSQNTKDALNNYTSSVTKTCDGKQTNVSSYEFWHKTKKDGARYLARARSINNGIVTETIYHEEFGRPIEVKQDTIITRYDYSKSGLLIKKVDSFRSQTFSYENSCSKVSEVVVVLPMTAQRQTAKVNEKRKQAPAKPKKIITKFMYDSPRCNLIAAKNSEGQTVQLSYDIRGRITKILDQSKKEVNITYDERFGKPEVVSRPGLGSIRFRYKADGTMDKFESSEDATVAIQVASIFSNLLEIIAPATTDMTNI